MKRALITTILALLPSVAVASLDCYSVCDSYDVAVSKSRIEMQAIRHTDTWEVPAAKRSFPSPSEGTCLNYKEYDQATIPSKSGVKSDYHLRNGKLYKGDTHLLRCGDHSFEKVLTFMKEWTEEVPVTVWYTDTVKEWICKEMCPPGGCPPYYTGGNPSGDRWYQPPPSITTAPVPEPTTSLLVGIGVIALAHVARRRR